MEKDIYFTVEYCIFRNHISKNTEHVWLLFENFRKKVKIYLIKKSKIKFKDKGRKMKWK